MADSCVTLSLAAPASLGRVPTDSVPAGAAFPSTVRPRSDNPIVGILCERLDGMAISTRTRFEVLKRDGFTCQYCGRNRDHDGVKLHVDHVVPVKEGGSDDPINLVAACQDCNLGKAAKILGDHAPVADVAAQTKSLEERREELRLYHEADKALAEYRNELLVEVWNYWFDVWDETSLPNSQTPNKPTLRRYIETIGSDDVKAAMDIAATKFRYVKNDAVRYFYGICKHKQAESEGRVVTCGYCKKWIVLDPGEDATAAWHHVQCKEAAEASAQVCAECKANPSVPGDELCQPCIDGILAELALDTNRYKHGPTYFDEEITEEIRQWDDLSRKAGL